MNHIPETVPDGVLEIFCESGIGSRGNSVRDLLFELSVLQRYFPANFASTIDTEIIDQAGVLLRSQVDKLKTELTAD